MRRLLPLLALFLAIGLIFVMGWHRALTLENLLHHRESLGAAIAANRLAAWAGFVLLYFAVAALSIPGASLLTIGGGALFGLWLGTAGALIGATAGGIVVFLIARGAFGEFIRPRLNASLAKLSEGFRENAFNYLLFLRLVPLFPFWLVNLAPAFFNVPLSTFSLATMLGIIPGTLAYALVGTSFDQLIAIPEQDYRACLAAGGADCRVDFNLRAALSPQLLLLLVGLGILFLIPPIIKRWRHAREKA